MVEIFKQSKIELLTDVVVFLHFCEVRSQIHRQLFVTDGVFENIFVHGLERSDPLLLKLFASADKRQLAADIVIGAVSRVAVPETHRFKLRTVHQNDAQTGIGIDGLLIVGLYQNVFPALEALFDFLRFFFKWIHFLPPKGNFMNLLSTLWEKHIQPFDYFRKICYTIGNIEKEEKILHRK